MHALPRLLLACALLLTPSLAAAASRPAELAQAINEASSPTASSGFDPAIARLQVLLDRAHRSPGAIDGVAGANLTRALAEEGVGPVERLQALAAADPRPAIVPYEITADDVKGPFASAPRGFEAQARRPSMPYGSATEALAEKFHMSEGFLRRLNPNARFAAGETILVAAVASTPIGEAASIEVDKARGRVRALGADGATLATFPATIGSAENPAPSGDYAVKAIAHEPKYYYRPERLPAFKDEGPDKPLEIAAGPNNPVGSVWIDLTLDSYGVHGTPNPATIGRSESHGCVRLTNWDAEALAAAVKPGVPVRFLE